MTTTLIVLGVLVGLFMLRVTIENNRVPELGVRDGVLKPLGKKPNNVSTQTDNAAKKVEPMPFKESPERTIAAIKQAVALYGGASIIEEREDYLYVVFSTKLMKYRDDAEFYLDTGSKLVHFRSSSRAGYSDLGVNRKRYEKLSVSYTAY